MAGVIADEAEDIEKRREPKPQRSAAQKIKPPPIPSSNQRQPQQTTQTTQVDEPELPNLKPQQPVPSQ